MVLCVCPNPSVDKFVWVEDFGKGKTNRTSKEQSFPGGKGVHVAMGIRELGEEVALLAFWGGPTGRWVKAQCESKGISCYGPEVDEWTRTSLTLKSNNEYNDTELLGVGPVIVEHDLKKFREIYEQLVVNVSTVCFSGSWPSNSMEADYGPLIDKATELAKLSFIDCSGQGLKNALQRKPYGVHINHLEGFDIYNIHDPVEIIKQVARNSRLMAISCGAEGLYLSDGHDVVHALSRVSDVISAVGSGDSLMAGMVVALINGYNLVDTAKLAAACGAANCIREELGMFYKKDVDELQLRCKTKKIDLIQA